MGHLLALEEATHSQQNINIKTISDIFALYNWHNVSNRYKITQEYTSLPSLRAIGIKSFDRYSQKRLYANLKQDKSPHAQMFMKICNIWGIVIIPLGCIIPNAIEVRERQK